MRLIPAWRILIRKMRAAFTGDYGTRKVYNEDRFGSSLCLKPAGDYLAPLWTWTGGGRMYC